MALTSKSNVVDASWWTQKGDELANTLGVVFGIVRDENKWRTDKDEYHWGLYEGTGLGGVSVSSRRNMTYANATLPDNVAKMGVDTLTAKVATIRPIPQVFADQGNWKDQRRAKKLRQLIEGEFYNQRVHEDLSARIIKDALVARAGVVQVHVPPKNGKPGKTPKVERCHIWTLFTDDWDAEFGEPLTMMRLRTMDRRKAVGQFGKTKDLKSKIQEAGRFSSNATQTRDEDRSSTVDRVELVEAWHRCPEHDDDDDDHECEGKHVIICDGAVLYEEDWPHDFFPFAILGYDTPNTGFWPSGLVQSIEGYQTSINDANCKLDEMYELSGKAVLLRDGSGIFKTDIVNGLRIIHCKPGPYEPQVFDIDLVNEHMRLRAPELVERALNAMGVSQMSAQSKKPAGVDAAVALQTLDDIESQRHIVFGRRFESWCMNVARLLIECIKKIANDHGDHEVKVPMKGAYLPLKWSEVKLDGFQLQMQTVGQLFNSFTGRLDKLQALFDKGLIDGPTFMRNLDAGDLQGELDAETVDRLRADEMIEAMLDAESPRLDSTGQDRNYLAPDPYLSLEWTHKRAHQRRNEAMMRGASEYMLGLLGKFIDDLDYIIDPTAATAMTPDGGPIDPNAMQPPPPPPGPGGGLPIMPEATTPAGDQLMQPPPMGMPIAA